MLAMTPEERTERAKQGHGEVGGSAGQESSEAEEKLKWQSTGQKYQPPFTAPFPCN
jgi:hypothetical protein